MDGFLKAFVGIVKRIIPMFKMLYYANIIRSNGGKNNFFLLDEQYNYLVSIGFQDITDSSKVFGDQSILNTAIK